MRTDGALAGAHLDMASAVRNCVELLGVPLTQALRFASAEPASFLGHDGSLGRIVRGYCTDLDAFDPGHLDVHTERGWQGGLLRDRRTSGSQRHAVKWKLLTRQSA